MNAPRRPLMVSEVTSSGHEFRVGWHEALGGPDIEKRSRCFDDPLKAVRYRKKLIRLNRKNRAQLRASN